MDTSVLERGYMGVSVTSGATLELNKVRSYCTTLLIVYCYSYEQIKYFINNGANVYILSRSYNHNLIEFECRYYVVGDLTVDEFIMFINPFAVIERDSMKQLNLLNYISGRIHMNKSLEPKITKLDCNDFAVYTITVIQHYRNLIDLSIQINIDALITLDSLATLYLQSHHYSSKGVSPVIMSYKQIPEDILGVLRQVRWILVSIAETVCSKLQQIKEYNNQ